MPRRAAVWYRKATGWWMFTQGSQQVKLLRGPNDEATRQLAEETWIERRKQQRERPDSVAATVADVVESFLEWSERNLAADTYRVHQYYGGSLVRRCGEVFVSQFKPLHITNWIHFMMDPERAAKDKKYRVWKDTTAFNAKRFAFRVMNWAKEEGWLAVNPLAGMKRPKPHLRRRPMTDDEFAKMHAAANQAFADLLFALRETGARPKELRDLVWDDVQGKRCILGKHKTAKKTGEPRIITLSRAMVAMLKRRKAESKTEYVFTNKLYGKPWTMNAVRLQFSNLRKRLGLAPDLCAYLARHGFGTRAILRGVDPMTVATLMGHKSLDMVSKVYVHLSNEEAHLQDAVEKINAKRPRKT